jgi:hypothetical protein
MSKHCDAPEVTNALISLCSRSSNCDRKFPPDECDTRVSILTNFLSNVTLGLIGELSENDGEAR